jgi:hypothetical protein
MKANIAMTSTAYLVKNPAMTMRVVKKMMKILTRVKEMTVSMTGCLIRIVGMHLTCRFSVKTQATNPLTEWQSRAPMNFLSFSSNSAYRSSWKTLWMDNPVLHYLFILVASWVSPLIVDDFN